MKIIVMDSVNVRIGVLNVPDHMIAEDIEQFLAEHDYSLNNISWMAAPIDFVPVQFHNYGICKTNGGEIIKEHEPQSDVIASIWQTL